MMENQDYSNVKQDVVEDHCLVRTKSLGTASMMLKLGGLNSQYMFIEDPILAELIYQHAVADLNELVAENDVYFKDEKSEIIYEAVLRVVYFKHESQRVPALTTVGAIKVKPFLGARHPNSELTFVRIFNIPCK